MLSARNLVKTMDQKRIIDDVNIDIEDGQTIVIIGPSGSGKSTLLRLLTELIRADNGMIKYDDLYMCKKGENGAIYSDKKTLKKINQKFGFIFQNFALFENLSVLENVSLSLRYVKKLKKHEADKKAYEALKSLGLENEISKNVDNLSGGQKQRVSIARTLVMRPEIIFFDEPT
ncbi:MAG: ATP-binding cassette domain-containing protein, partial [Tissierellia bacterium]|nr:ATP-binding cassette domain-containing protein [Tissierellia bacterium]